MAVIETPLGSFTPTVTMLIGAELRGAQAGATYENVNPATESVLGVAPDASPADMDAAIAAARAAADTGRWSTDRGLRARCLSQLQAALESEREEMRAELVAETGCPVMLTYSGQLDTPLDEAIRWPMEQITHFEWERVLPDRQDGSRLSRRMVVKEPQGVVGAILPWNYPFEVMATKLGAILATGNTVVVKPAPDTPWSATRLGRLVAEKTDIPPGVVNVVTSSRREIGEQLVRDPRVDAISFTGSTAVGRHIAALGAATMKRMFLELGGKSAAIFCDDVDVEAAVPAAAYACEHAGQGCSIATRILLPRSRYDEGLAVLLRAMSEVRYGDPVSPEVLQGPQINSRQRDRVLGYIKQGVADGADLVLGGNAPPHLPRGFYVEPTVFAHADNSMVIAREEIFGPVVVVIPFDDDADAVRIANDSPYGLAAEVYSSTPERGASLARRLRAGAISVNGGNWYGADAPYGGYKSSGIGRQNGREGLEVYLETKTVAIAG